MEIQIDFVKPELVSRTAQQRDQVKVNFTQAWAFKSTHGIQMSPNVSVLEQDIPKQFAKNAIIIELGSAPMVLLNAQFFIQFFFKALMNSLLGVIQSLSLIMHMFVISLDYPAELTTFMNQIFRFVTFEVIPYIDEIYDYGFNFAAVEADPPIND